MRKYELFINSPIVEAILEIKVQLPENTEIDFLESVYDDIKERFQEKEEQLFFENGVNGPRVKTARRGFYFYSKEDGKVVQSRLDGFAFNKLKPYERWEAFHQEAKNLWGAYARAVKPVNIVGASLRYINRIEAPLPMDDFSDYILTNPRIAPGIPQYVRNFSCGSRYRIRRSEHPPY